MTRIDWKIQFFTATLDKSGQFQKWKSHTNVFGTHAWICTNSNTTSFMKIVPSFYVCFYHILTCFTWELSYDTLSPFLSVVNYTLFTGIETREKWFSFPTFNWLMVDFYFSIIGASSIIVKNENERCKQLFGPIKKSFLFSVRII